MNFSSHGTTFVKPSKRSTSAMPSKRMIESSCRVREHGSESNVSNAASISSCESKSFTIQEARTAGEYRDIQELRRWAFHAKTGVEETRKQTQARESNMDAHSVNLLARDSGGRCIACVRITYRKDGPFQHESELELQPFREKFGDRSLSQATRLIAHPDHSQSVLLRDLMREVVMRMVNEGVGFHFLHCRPVRFAGYERLGYRQYTSSFHDRDFGLETPMVLVGDDLLHLKNVRSPLLSLLEARSMEGGDQWFRRRFCSRMDRSSPFDLKRSAFFFDRTRFADGTIPAEFVALLRRQSPNAIQRILRQSRVIDVESGTILSRIEIRSDHIFILLEGKAGSEGLAREKYENYAPGDVIGGDLKVRFGKQIRAVTSCRLLVIRSRLLKNGNG